jgi:arylsulfatase
MRSKTMRSKTMRSKTMRSKTMTDKTRSLFALLLCGLCLSAGTAYAARQPNIVVIWGDDTGRSNISKYTHGLMGYRTPNIDRIADEGMFFTDYYTENSCTAGRAAFIQGQAVFRTGNSKVGLPGAHQGIDAKDPTIAELLKPLGYATAQFGKNHLGDRNEYLPTVHTRMTLRSTRASVKWVSKCAKIPAH